MSNTESLKSKLEDLERERNRLLRGFGSRYSYTHRLKSNPEGNKKKLKNNRSRIKTVKARLISISDEIHDINKEIEQEELHRTKSSEQFDSTYSDTLKSFDR